MMDSGLYKRDLDVAFAAYQRHNTSGQEYRQNGIVPYANHAIWAATTVLLDVHLPQKIRELGYVVLLYHDVLEDTSAAIPPWVSEEALHCINEMTFKNFRSSLAEIPGKSPLIKLFILVDKLSTLIEEHIAPVPEKRKLWRDTVAYLANEVEAHFGRTRIVIMARAFVEATPW